MRFLAETWSWRSVPWIIYLKRLSFTSWCRTHWGKESLARWYWPLSTTSKANQVNQSTLKSCVFCMLLEFSRVCILFHIVDIECLDSLYVLEVLKFVHSNILAIRVVLEVTHNSNICTYWSYGTFSFTESGLWVTAVTKIVKHISTHTPDLSFLDISHIWIMKLSSFARSICVIVTAKHTAWYFLHWVIKLLNLQNLAVQLFSKFKMWNTCRHLASQKSHKLKIMKLLLAQATISIVCWTFVRLSYAFQTQYKLYCFMQWMFIIFWAIYLWNFILNSEWNFRCYQVWGYVKIDLV